MHHRSPLLERNEKLSQSEDVYGLALSTPKNSKFKRLLLTPDDQSTYYVKHPEKEDQLPRYDGRPTDGVNRATPMQNLPVVLVEVNMIERSKKGEVCVWGFQARRPH